MPEGVVMPQLPAVHVVLVTEQLGQLVEPLPAVQAVVAELLEELLAVLLATELEALLLATELLLAVLVATELLAFELETELATELAAELATEEDLLLELTAELDALELAAELDALLLLATDEAELDEAFAAVIAMEHSFLPPATRAPNVASTQSKLPLSVA